MVCWLVGGKCVVPDHPRSTLDSPRHFQTSKGTNTNNFPVNQNHPRRPQTPLTELQKIQDFDFFWNRSSDFDPPRLNWQLQPRLKWTKIPRYYMETLLWGKRWHNKSPKMAEPNCRPGSVPIIISGQGKMVCWLVGGKCVKGNLSHINIRQLQTVLNIKIEQYKQLFYQPKPSQASLRRSQRIQPTSMT